MQKFKITHYFVQKIENWFNQFAENKIKENPDVAFFLETKLFHTHKVRTNARIIAESLSMKAAEIQLSETIALLHDIGRFPQMINYKTFDDNLSEDHSILAIKEIKTCQLLDKLTQREAEIIEYAVFNHNKKRIDDSLDSEQIIMAKLIRDADKIDIYRVVSHHHEKSGKSEKSNKIVLDLPKNGDISMSVYQDIVERKIVERKNVKSSEDHIALQAAWVFDINFPISLKLIKNQPYIKELIDLLPETEKGKEIRKIVYKELDKVKISC